MGNGDIPVYFDFFPGQGMAMFRVSPCIKWKWFIPVVKVRVDFGVALCSPRDVFDFDEGKTLAYNRLEAFIEGRENLRDRGLAGSWTMSHKDWNEVLRAKREQEFLLDTLVDNFPITRPWSWEQVIQ